MQMRKGNCEKGYCKATIKSVLIFTSIFSLFKLTLELSRFKKNLERSSQDLPSLRMSKHAKKLQGRKCDCACNESHACMHNRKSKALYRGRTKADQETSAPKPCLCWYSLDRVSIPSILPV